MLVRMLGGLLVVASALLSSGCWEHSPHPPESLPPCECGTNQDGEGTCDFDMVKDDCSPGPGMYYYKSTHSLIIIKSEMCGDGSGGSAGSGGGK